ncbi:hypothetical protein AB2N04_13170 [Nitratireductor sp. GISD-1A_MAKvit]|uniref:hypothetical protein n=1 Tax=Nitratireductor sp. GISD-1A_MAKvit TaxID=3234198 RepID=UPI0034653D30
MAIDGRRDFAALLDELIDEEAERLSGAGASLNSLDYLSVAEELHSGRINFTDRRVQAEYGQHQKETVEQPKKTRKKQVPPPPPPSTDPQDIARELGLHKSVEPQLLDRLRREFAFRNHPDRVPEHLRANAMTRMQVANMLIDEAKRGAVRPRGAGEARA